MQIIEQIVHPIDKSPLRLEGSKLIAPNGDAFSFENGVFKLLPISTSNYMEHYQIDAELFDYFEVPQDKVQIEDERRLRQMIAKYAGSNIGHLLDVGAGSGWTAGSFGSKAQSITFSDISDLNLMKIKEKFSLKNANYVQCDSLNMPFAENTFDTIIASEVIEHVPDPALFIENLLAILKPNGKLIITTPYKEKLQFYLCVHCNKPTPRNAHLHSFDEQKLIQKIPNSSRNKVEYSIFGSKIIIFSRALLLLKFLPFSLWKIIDKAIGLVIKKNAHILLEIKK